MGFAGFKYYGSRHILENHPYLADNMRVIIVYDGSLRTATVSSPQSQKVAHFNCIPTGSCALTVIRSAAANSSGRSNLIPASIAFA